MGKSIVLGIVCVLALVSCAEKDGTYPTKSIEFIAPGGAGGGWDLTIRTVDKVLHDSNLIDFPTPVVNKPGGGGGVTLAYLQNKKDADNIITVYSPPLLLINLNGSSPYSYKDVTPIARLISEYAAFIVLKDSPLQNIQDLISELKRDPKSLTVGGVSSVGSMDHLKFLVLADNAGITDLKNISYVSFQDGSALSQMLGGHISVYAGDISDAVGLIESGDVRVLGVSSPSRLEQFPDIPTIKEQGVDMIFVNWRGLFAPKNMPEEIVSYWRELIGKMVVTPEWSEAVQRNGWTDTYLDGSDFSSFLDETNESYKNVLRTVGLYQGE